MKNKIRNWILTLFSISGPILILTHVELIENTINIGYILLMCSIVGLILGGAIALTLKVLDNKNILLIFDLFEINVGIIIGFILFVPGIALTINYSFTSGIEGKCKNYIIIEKEKSKILGRNTHGFNYYFYVETKTKSNEKFKVYENIYNQYEEGSEISICTKKGHLGYEFVSKFN
jgi:hypothetical protein